MPSAVLRRIGLPAAFFLLAAAPIAHAQTFFPNDAIIATPLNGEAYVGYANGNDANNKKNSTSPAVSLTGGGSVTTLYAYNSSNVTISGGSASAGLRAVDNSVVTINSGDVRANMLAFNSSTFNINGGSIGGTLSALDSSTFNLFGMGLSDILVDPNSAGVYSKYTLFGALSDGSSINGKTILVQNGTGARFTLNNVPEPGSMALLVGLTGVGLLGCKRRK